MTHVSQPLSHKKKSNNSIENNDDFYSVEEALQPVAAHIIGKNTPHSIEIPHEYPLHTKPKTSLSPKQKATIAYSLGALSVFSLSAIGFFSTLSTPDLLQAHTTFQEIKAPTLSYEKCMHDQRTQSEKSEISDHDRDQYCREKFPEINISTPEHQ